MYVEAHVDRRTFATLVSAGIHRQTVERRAIDRDRRDERERYCSGTMLPALEPGSSAMRAGSLRWYLAMRPALGMRLEPLLDSPSVVVGWTVESVLATERVVRVRQVAIDLPTRGGDGAAGGRRPVVATNVEPVVRVRIRAHLATVSQIAAAVNAQTVENVVVLLEIPVTLALDVEMVTIDEVPRAAGVRTRPVLAGPFGVGIPDDETGRPFLVYTSDRDVAAALLGPGRALSTVLDALDFLGVMRRIEPVRVTLPESLLGSDLDVVNAGLRVSFAADAVVIRVQYEHRGLYRSATGIAGPVLQAWQERVRSEWERFLVGEDPARRRLRSGEQAAVWFDGELVRQSLVRTLERAGGPGDEDRPTSVVRDVRVGWASDVSLALRAHFVLRLVRACPAFDMDIDVAVDVTVRYSVAPDGLRVDIALAWRVSEWDLFACSAALVSPLALLAAFTGGAAGGLGAALLAGGITELFGARAATRLAQVIAAGEGRSFDLAAQQGTETPPAERVERIDANHYRVTIPLPATSGTGGVVPRPVRVVREGDGLMIATELIGRDMSFPASPRLGLELVYRDARPFWNGTPPRCDDTHARFRMIFVNRGEVSLWPCLPSFVGLPDLPAEVVAQLQPTRVFRPRQQSVAVPPGSDFQWTLLLPRNVVELPVVRGLRELRIVVPTSGGTMLVVVPDPFRRLFDEVVVEGRVVSVRELAEEACMLQAIVTRQPDRAARGTPEPRVAPAFLERDIAVLTLPVRGEIAPGTLADAVRRTAMLPGGGWILPHAITGDDATSAAHLQALLITRNLPGR